MWQHLLDRFVPLMDGDASALDQHDGVGASTGLASGQATDGSLVASRGPAAFEGPSGH